MNVKNKKLCGVLLCILALQGCQSDNTGKTKAEQIRVQTIEELNNKNMYASIDLGSDKVLMAGESGMTLVDIDTGNEVASEKERVFKLPKFQSYEQTESKRMAAAERADGSNDSNATNQTVDKPKIYTLLNLGDGILVGGKFATVNGIAKENIVKLNYSGEIDSDFNGSVNGTVYKMIRVNQHIYVAGLFGGYNNTDAYSIVKIDAKGAKKAEFLPFQDYSFVKINDMDVYGDDKLIVAGTFVKEMISQDENMTKDELVAMTKSILILDQNGNIMKEESAKFETIKNETFAIAKDEDRLFIAGDFEFVKNDRLYKNLVAFTIEGEHDEDFQIDVLQGMIFDVALLDDKMVFGGDFISVDDNSTSRSFYVTDKAGKTVKIENFKSDADIYNVDVYNGKIIISGEGEFKINDQGFVNSIALSLAK